MLLCVRNRASITAQAAKEKLKEISKRSRVQAGLSRHRGSPRLKRHTSGRRLQRGGSVPPRPQTALLAAPRPDCPRGVWPVRLGSLSEAHYGNELWPAARTKGAAGWAWSAGLSVGCGDRRSDATKRHPCCAVVTFSFREREAGFVPRQNCVGLVVEDEVAAIGADH